VCVGCQCVYVCVTLQCVCVCRPVYYDERALIMKSVCAFVPFTTLPPTHVASCCYLCLLLFELLLFVPLAI